MEPITWTVVYVKPNIEGVLVRGNTEPLPFLEVVREAADVFEAFEMQTFLSGRIVDGRRVGGVPGGVQVRANGKAVMAPGDVGWDEMQAYFRALRESEPSEEDS